MVATSRSEIEVARQDPIHQLALFLLSVHAQRIVPGNAKTKTSTAEVVKAKEARKASAYCHGRGDPVPVRSVCIFSNCRVRSSGFTNEESRGNRPSGRSGTHKPS